MKPSDAEQLRILAAAVVADAGVDLDVEDVIVVAAGRRSVVRVIVDGDAGVSLDAAAEVSRALAAALDAEGDSLFGDAPYTLEVSSPGVGRALTEERHYRRSRGRLLSLKMFDGGTVQGRVRRALNGTVELLADDGTDVTVVPLADIRKARVEVEFAAMPAAHAAMLAADGFVDPARAFDESADALPENDTGEDTDADTEYDTGEDTEYDDR